jgi:ketosteroid isomerase-like protein
MDRDALRSRVQLLEDERAILGVLHAYGHAIDYGDEERYLDLWTDGAAFDARGRGAGDAARVVRGREALADFAAHFSRPPQGWHKHLVIEPLIEVEGDAASATSYFAVLREEGCQPILWVFGRYRDTLARCADGRWRLSLRIAEVESADRRYPSLAFVR